jgi:hypothetical protein
LITLPKPFQNARVNGVRPKIEIFKPFGQAFELANKILFQPFDPKKWFVIGFAAFLSGHLAGVGFNFPSSFGNFQSDRASQDVIPAHFEEWKPWLVAVPVVLAPLFFAFSDRADVVESAWQFHFYRLYRPKSGSDR